MAIKKNTKIIFVCKSPYTSFPNEEINKIKNIDALGVYCYLYSRPFDHVISHEELQNHFNCDENHIEKCLEYLISCGVIL